MKKVILALCLLCLALPVSAMDTTDLPANLDECASSDTPEFIFGNSMEVGDFSLLTAPAYTAISFTDGVDEILVISWEDGIVDIEYSNVSEAAEAFFEFLKAYIEEGYDITPKTKEAQ